MANFAFKETKTTAMKVVGIVDTDNMTVDVDGEVKSIATLMSAFNGGCVEINIKTKEETELDEPQANTEE